ncbi:MAG TPA: N-acetylmuramoyl-L-alanine amidase [Chthoniobacterales bacterium]
MRRALPWFGLLLLAISFVWLLRTPAPKEPPIAAARKPVLPVKHPFVVVLDPGHGGDDSGAICGEVLEKDLTLDVAQRAESLLRAAGFTTVMTRDRDQQVSLADRVSLGNRASTSLFVSIHFNDGQKSAAIGVETYYSPVQSTRPSFLAWFPFFQPASSGPLTAKSETLASYLQTALIARTGAVDRGIKTEPFYVIENLRHPAALIEGGFITNKDEVAKLATAQYREQLARAICEGVRAYRTAVEHGEPTFALAAAPPE